MGYEVPQPLTENQMIHNQAAADINRMKYEALVLQGQIDAKAVAPPSYYPSFATLERLENNLRELRAAIDKKQQELNDSEHRTNEFAVIDDEVGPVFATHPDPTKQAPQTEANRLANLLNETKRQILRINQEIQRATTEHEPQKSTEVVDAQRALTAAQQALATAQQEERSSPGVAAYAQVVLLKQATVTEAQTRLTAAQAAARTPAATSEVVTDLNTKKTYYITLMTGQRTALYNYERAHNVYGIAQPTPLAVHADLAPYMHTHPDFMDTSYVPPTAPPAHNPWGSPYAHAEYYVSSATRRGTTLLATLGKHLAIDEFTDPKERTFVKQVDFLFSILLFSAIGYGAYKYVGYEDGTASAEDALLTLTLSTYAIAGLAVAYAFCIGYAVLRDKIEENRLNTLKAHGTTQTFNIEEVARHEKTALQLGGIGVLFTIGFAAIASLQSDTLTTSVTGIMLAPLAAIMFALAMNAKQEAEIARTTQHDYVAKTLTQKAKENIIGIAVALVGLVVVYHGAVGMSEHKGNADALGEDIKFMTRAIALLFALGGLATGYKKTTEAESAAMQRKIDLRNKFNPDTAFLYHDNGTINVYAGIQEGRDKDRVIPDAVPMTRMSRRTDGRLHFALGCASLLGFAIMAVEASLSAEQKIGATLLAAIAGIFFTKWGNNMEKHHDKIGRITTSYEQHYNPTDRSVAPKPSLRHTT